ncbi:hypothetical protein Pfo_031493 [Paulownia fortunei]|nr:hypothetical protein Pfo_031493 [Paulownia fortunei]
MVSEIKTLVTFFGGTGDLAKRKLYPSVFNLYKKGYLQKHFAIVGTARQALNDDEFKQLVRDSIKDFTDDQAQAEAFIEHFSYRAHDVTDAASYAVLKEAIEEAADKFDIDGNRIFLYDYIKNVQVTLSEVLGVEERAGYYDTAGALLDMIQNHTMQIVGWLAMEKPESFTDKDIRAAKNAAFNALKIYDEAEVNKYFVRAQYGAGDSADFKPYLEELDVPADSKNNTFIAGELQFDLPRWEGVPFYVRSEQEAQEAVLSIIIDPKGAIELKLNAKSVEDAFNTRTIDLGWTVSDEDKKNTPEPYERMIHDTMNGDGSNFADWNGVSIAWKFVDAISAVYTADKAPLETYKSGSMGPEASDKLLAANVMLGCLKVN